MGRTHVSKDLPAVRKKPVFANQRPHARGRAGYYRIIFERIYVGHRFFRHGIFDRSRQKSENGREIQRRRVDARFGLSDLRRSDRDGHYGVYSRIVADYFRQAKYVFDLDIFRSDLFDAYGRRVFSRSGWLIFNNLYFINR